MIVLLLSPLNQSSLVTRNTSSKEVTPLRIFLQPSIRNVFIPASIAAFLTNIGSNSICGQLANFIVCLQIFIQPQTSGIPGSTTGTAPVGTIQCLPQIEDFLHRKIDGDIRSIGNMAACISCTKFAPIAEP